MHFVYIIQSKRLSDKVYGGIASDMKARLNQHNEGANKHTTKFKGKARAATFERYLKSSSGIAFRRKRLL